MDMTRVPLLGLFLTAGLRYKCTSYIYFEVYRIKNAGTCRYEYEYLLQLAVLRNTMNRLPATDKRRKRKPRKSSWSLAYYDIVPNQVAAERWAESSSRLGLGQWAAGRLTDQTSDFIQLAHRSAVGY